MTSNPFPTQLLLQNFGSHKNTRLTFGALKDRCYITGSSGSGKSHILNAIQYVLGRKIERDNEFFTYEEIDEGGIKSKVYMTRAKIELTVLNSGPEALNIYPIDEELTIGLEAFKGNRKRNRRYIRIKGEERRITLEELKSFGDWKDPLIFIDDQQTAIWTQKSPKERYNAVSRFIGIDDFKEKVKNTRDELEQVGKKIDEVNKNLREFHIKFQTIEASYNRYQKKVEFEKILSELKVKELQAQIHNIFNNFHETQDTFIRIYEENEKLKEEIENYKVAMNTCTTKIKNIQDKFQTQEEEKSKVKEELVDVEIKIREFTTKLQTVSKYLKDNNIDISKISNYSETQRELDQKEQELNETNAGFVNLQKEYKEYKQKLSEISKKKFSIPHNIIKVQKELEKTGIKSELLFETLEFRPGSERWHDYIENILSSNKRGIVVEEEHGRKAEKINRDLKSDAIILSPRRSYVLKRKQGLRDWADILEVSPQVLNSETVDDLMNLMMHNSYFADTFEEKEQFLAISPYSRIYCQDGYTYNVYSQRKFRFVNTSYMIGKGAVEREKNRLTSLITKLSTQMEELSSKIADKTQDLEIIEKKLDDLNLKKKEHIIDELRDKSKQLSNEFNEIVSILANPQQNIQRLKDDIERYNRLREEKRESIEDNTLKLTNLISELNFLSNSFKNLIEQWILIKNLEPGEEELQLIQNINVDDTYQYLEIIKETKKFLKKIEVPTETLDVLKENIIKTQSALEQYQDVDSSVVKIYEDTQNQIKTIENLNTQFELEKGECEEKFYMAVENLKDKLMKWQDMVSRRYTSIMKGLNLDGELQFTQTDIEGDYQLNIHVSNIPGGSLDAIEHANFSKGERLRASIAFEIAILAESPSPFSVWDEFDQNIAEDHKELLARVIEQHLPDKKLICISPYTPTPGYIRIFPHIIQVWKNQNKESQISLINFDKDVKRAGDLTDAIREH